jgi:hypothetical protein
MVEAIKNYLKHSVNPLLVAIVILVAFVGMMALQGCNLASLISVNVPPAVKTAVDIPNDERVSLDVADTVWEDWIAHVNSNTRKFESAIDDANERYAVIKQLTDIGLKAAGEQASGIPGGTILLSGLSLLGGLFLKRPGEDALVAKEKRDSYNKGLEVGATITKAPDPAPVTDKT